MSDHYSAKSIPGLRQPPVLLELLSFAIGVLLLLLVVAGVAVNIGAFRALVIEGGALAAAEDLFSMAESGGRATRNEILLALSATSFLISALIYAVVLVRVGLGGLRLAGGLMGKPLLRLRTGSRLPPNAPGNFGSTDNVVRHLKNHTVETHAEMDSELFKYLALVFGPNVRFVTPTQWAVLKAVGLSFRGRWRAIVSTILFFGALIAGSIWLTSSVERIVSENPGLWLLRIGAIAGSREFILIPAVWILGLLIVLAVVEYVFMSLIVPSHPPSTQGDEGSEDFQSAGAPKRIIGRMPDLSVDLAWRDFRNRTLVNRSSETALNSVGDAGDFSGQVVVEQQPQAIRGRGTLANYVWWIAASGLTVAGVIVAMFLLRPNSFLFDWSVDRNNPLTIAWTPFFIYAMGRIAGKAIDYGGVAMNDANRLFHTRWFKSVLIVLDVSGTVSRADIRVGRGKEDSIETSATVVRSDFSLDMRCAEVVSEADTLDAPRTMVAAGTSPDTRRWIQTYQTRVRELAAEGIRPPAVELESDAVNDVVRANLEVSARREGEVEAARIAAQKLGPAETPSAIEDARSTEARPEAAVDPESDPNYTHCPECGEPIRRIARKCRFCGYRLDQKDD